MKRRDFLTLAGVSGPPDEQYSDSQSAARDAYRPEEISGRLSH